MLNPEIRETLLSLSTPFFVDARSNLGLPESHLDHGIRPIVPFTGMVGTAVTVRLEVAPNEDLADLMPLGNVYQSQSNSSFPIIVIQVPAELHEHGIFGEGYATLARGGGFVGALVDGAVRDTQVLRDMEFPAFSRTVAPGYIVGRVYTAAIAEPVLVGGRTIHHGDVIVADNDGVVVIRPDELDDVVAQAQAIEKWEHRVYSMLAAGGKYEEVMKITGLKP